MSDALPGEEWRQHPEYSNAKELWVGGKNTGVYYSGSHHFTPPYQITAADGTEHVDDYEWREVAS